MRQPKPDAQAPAESAEPKLGNRLIAALLAPIVVNVSILLLSGIFFRPYRSSDRLLFSSLSHASVGLVIFALIVLPALAGFMLGATRGLALLSHLLLINPAAEISTSKTLMAWGVLLLISYLASGLIG